MRRVTKSNVSVCALGLLALHLDSRQAPAVENLSISWVSTDRAAFDPAKGEEVELRFRISAPSTVSVRFVDPHELPVRSFSLEIAKPGDQRIRWDGKNDDGIPVPPEAYAYTISASPLGSDYPTKNVTYDLHDRTGGDAVFPFQPTLDPKTGLIRYALSRSSRVRVIVSRQDTAWPILTLMDWAPRTAGKHEEAWDGWDRGHVVNALETPNLIPIFYAFSLPDNTVIVEGEPSGKVSTAPMGRVVHKREVSTERSLHHHAKHPRARCYDPLIEASFPESVATTGEGISVITEPTHLRFDIASEQGAGRLSPIPRVSVFIFVDGRLIERYLVGYVPYQWRVDPARLGPGEHVITGLLTWRDDHFGIAHVRVSVE